MAAEGASGPFGEEARRLIEARGLSLRAVAAKAGVDKAYLSRALREREPASLDLIERVARALDLPEDYFLETQRARILKWLEGSPRATRQVYKRAVHRDAVEPPGET